MNRSSILRISGILAAAAFTLWFLVSAFNSFGGVALLNRFGLDFETIIRINSGVSLLGSVLLAAAFGVLAMDRENLVAGLFGVVYAGIGCVFSFGVLRIHGNNVFCWSLVYIAHIALTVMLFLSVVFIKNNVSRTLRFLAIAAAAYMVVSQLIWQGVNVYCKCSGISSHEMRTIYTVVRFFTTLPGLLSGVILVVYFIAQACTSDRCQASCDDGAYLPPQQ